uniref:DDE Tnp4 domain-containing protein n=1 Tax=Photinus pyralis TaxID=7054 RepID=A0A1Y1LTG0_PHOPY
MSDLKNKLMFVKALFDDDSSDYEWFSDSSLEAVDFNVLNEDRSKRVRVENYLEVIDKYSEEDFRRHFRLSRATANLCIDDLENDNVLPTHTYGREKICCQKAFYMTLWYLSNEETYRQISDRFDVAESTAWTVTRSVIDHLVNKSNAVITWPTEEDAIKIEKEFASKQGVQGIIGAIDGSHIIINKPGTNQHAYCNRKGTHSIILQGVVDSRKRFINVFCGEPGSLHDARVFKRSPLYRRITENDLPLNNHFLVGDSAYPSTLPWLITPYKDNGKLTSEQRTFNYRHSSTRVIVENAFGLLKGRFRRLRCFEHKDIKFIVKCVIAACTLHNICIDAGETTEDIEEYTDLEPEQL